MPHCWKSHVAAHLFIYMPSLAGPVAGALTVKFGYRFVNVLGAVLEALGVFLSAFTPNLEFMYFSVGILIGKILRQLILNSLT